MLRFCNNIILGYKCNNLSRTIFQKYADVFFINGRYYTYFDMDIIVCAAIGLYILKSKLCNQRNIASLYVIQFICFLVCLISRYCFKAYAFSMISCLTSIILTTVLTVKLLKEKQYYIFAVLCFYLVMLICCLFTCVIFCSLEYGVWKD